MRKLVTFAEIAVKDVVKAEISYYGELKARIKARAR